MHLNSPLTKYQATSTEMSGTFKVYVEGSLVYETYVVSDSSYAYYFDIPSIIAPLFDPTSASYVSTLSFDASFQSPGGIIHWIYQTEPFYNSIEDSVSSIPVPTAHSTCNEFYIKYLNSHGAFSTWRPCGTFFRTDNIDKSFARMFNASSNKVLYTPYSHESSVTYTVSTGYISQADADNIAINVLQSKYVYIKSPDYAAFTSAIITNTEVSFLDPLKDAPLNYTFTVQVSPTISR